MSADKRVRDEIADLLATQLANSRRGRHKTVADAFMPIVERVVWEALEAGRELGFEGATADDAAECWPEIVRDVLGVSGE